MRTYKIITLLFISVLLSACITARPQRINNICSIFRQYPTWYWASEHVEKKWNLPIPVLMAIIHQESHFNADALPPRKTILWIIPWFRPSTAYGYSQALNPTWRLYINQTGNKGADRDNFKDAIDFIGWYSNRLHRRSGISLNNAYGLYLAYHEGGGGYNRRTYLQKPWLIQVARKVQRQANTYRWQYDSCKNSLPQKPWYRIW